MPSGLSKLSVDEIRERYARAEQPVSLQALGKLKRDPRHGVRLIYAALKKRYERDSADRARLDAMLNFERVLWRAGVQHIAGVDEVGMGPLAGPVIAAAVVFPPQTALYGIDDSKKLDVTQRVDAERRIRAAASGIAIGRAEVDRLMDELAREHPEYGFERHKGYCTPEHQDTIRRLGPSAIHRKSFTFIRELRGEYSAVFYDLKRRLDTAATARELQAIDRELGAIRGALADNEQRKLRLVLSRRWRAL